MSVISDNQSEHFSVEWNLIEVEENNDNVQPDAATKASTIGMG